MNKKEITAENFLPNRQTIPSLRNAAKTCKGCHLYKKATQTVFGEGANLAKLMIVGEIPGNKEDITGHPFRGPAGTFLYQSIEKIGIDLEDVYFTNVVKHFKFEFLNNRRMHRSPVSSEIRACLPWLQTEIKVVKPKIILCLGAVAAKTLISKNFRMNVERGKWINSSATFAFIATFHPSAILRATSDESRHELKNIFLKDLKKIALKLKKI